MTFSNGSTSGTVIHRLAGTKSNPQSNNWRRRRRASSSLQRDAATTDHSHEHAVGPQDDEYFVDTTTTNSKAHRNTRRFFTKNVSALSTRALSVAVIVIQALVLMTLQQQLLCHNCGGILHMMVPSHYRKDARHFPITVQSTVSHDFLHVIRLSTNDNNERHSHWIHNRRERHYDGIADNKENRPEYKPVTPLPESCQGQDWMNDLHPSCLDIHEIDLADFFFNEERDYVRIDNGSKRRKKVKIIGEGGFRNAIMFHEEGATGMRRVLKTLVYDEPSRDFSPRTYDKMRRDAVISEQLTASPYISDIYGYCGLSAVVDYSNEKNLDYVYEQHPTKDELFQIAHDVAQSIADAHHLNEQGQATVVHMDIKPDQWIRLEGRFKLNDFNLARMITWDPVTGESCDTATGYSGSRYQAPEQYTEDRPRTEKIDVFSLGNVLGFLLTDENPYEDLSMDAAEAKIEKGEIWKIHDPKVLNSTHPFDVSVLKAMNMCLKVEPSERPSAQEVADFLRNALHEYKRSQKGETDEPIVES
jgi:hypothetical protein